MQLENSAQEPAQPRDRLSKKKSELPLVRDINDLPEKMTKREVCAWLFLSERMVEDMAKLGQIPHVRLCRTPNGKGILRFDRNELIAWWAQQQQG